MQAPVMIQPNGPRVFVDEEEGFVKWSKSGTICLRILSQLQDTDLFQWGGISIFHSVK
jgi:hypothetical protein